MGGPVGSLFPPDGSLQPGVHLIPATLIDGQDLFSGLPSTVLPGTQQNLFAEALARIAPDSGNTLGAGAFSGGGFAGASSPHQHQQQQHVLGAPAAHVAGAPDVAGHGHGPGAGSGPGAAAQSSSSSSVLNAVPDVFELDLGGVGGPQGGGGLALPLLMAHSSNHDAGGDGDGPAFDYSLSPPGGRGAQQQIGGPLKREHARACACVCFIPVLHA